MQLTAIVFVGAICAGSVLAGRMHLSCVLLASASLFAGSDFAADASDAPKPAVTAFGSYKAPNGTVTEVLDNILRAYTKSTSVDVVKALYTEERVISEELVNNFKNIIPESFLFSASEMHKFAVLVIKELMNSPDINSQEMKKFNDFKGKTPSDENWTLKNVVDAVKEYVVISPELFKNQKNVDAVVAALDVLVDTYKASVANTYLQLIKIAWGEPDILSKNIQLMRINNELKVIAAYFDAIADKRWRRGQIIAIAVIVTVIVAIIAIIVIVKVRRAKASKPVNMA